MKTKFMCWHSEHSVEEDAIPREAWDPERAAELHAEERWAQDDYPDEQTIAVRAPDGTVTRWTVTMLFVPTFSARQVEEES